MFLHGQEITGAGRRLMISLNDAPSPGVGRPPCWYVQPSPAGELEFGV